MFFAALIVLIWALIAFKVPIDQFGWLMLVGTGWVAGYLDCRWFNRSDRDPDRVMPPGNGDDSDTNLFQP